MAQTLRSSIKGALNRSIKGGLLSPAQFRGSTLDLDFAGAKSLKNQIGKEDVVSFTRASSGTYVGSDGLIKTATTNLTPRSQEIDQSPWSNQNATVSSNAIIAPDGTLTADAILETVTTGIHTASQVSLSLTGTFTVSVFVKDAGRGFALLSLFTGVTPDVISVDLSSGVATTASGSPSNVFSTAVGDGWYRVGYTATLSGTYNLNIYSSVDGVFANRAYAGDITKGIYIWGAQLEQSDTVGEYVKTTSTINSAPRFDHDPTTGESLGLLVEESRTNLQADSEDLSGYNKNDVTTPLDSSVINPTGSTGSYKILANSGLATGGIRIYKSANSVNNIVVSAFVKKSTHRYTFIGFGGNVNSFTALFDIEPGLTSNRLLGQSGTGTYTNIDAGYQNFPNDWIRIWAVGTTAGNNGLTLGMGPDATTFDITNWTAAGTEEIYAWGLQYEDDVSFPTSYIPTEGSTVTRAADVASISGSNFSGWYNQSIGTLFCDVFLSRDIEQSSGNTGSWTLDNGSFARGIGMSHIAGTQARLFIRDSAYQATCNVVGISKSRIKTCALIKLNSNGLTQTNTMCANGVLGNNLAPYDISDEVTIDRLLIGNQNISGNPANNTLNGSIKRLTYWPQEVASNTRINITT